MDTRLMYILFNVGVITLVVVGLCMLFAMSMVVRDYEMIVKQPLMFLVELLAISLLPAIPVLLFRWTRGLSTKEAYIWFVSLAIKFAIFHVVSQLSGLYGFLFPDSKST